MSRSFGDLCACRAGVVQQPEIIDHQLSPDDKAIFLASDGVWEFLDNDKVMNILTPHLEAGTEEKGVSEVIKASVTNWKKEDVVIDDITAVLAIISSTSSGIHKTTPDKNQMPSRSLHMKSTHRSISNFH